MKRLFTAATLGFCAFAMCFPGAPQAVGQEESSDNVYVIPIRKEIEPALLYVIRRGVTEADKVEANAVIFVMDTPGGTLAAAEEIINTIENIKTPTFTFVEKKAISAGAMIALATEHIFMAPGSQIGDCMPILVSMFGGVEEPSDAIQEKGVSFVAAKMRSTAQKNGHDDKLAEAMVRREMEYKIGDEVICPKGQLLTLTNIEAARLVGEGDEQRPLLSEGTVADLDEMLDVIGLSGATIHELEITPAERVARWIAALAPIFLMLGLLGIYIEVKTPGFGVPGIAGAVFLAIFFWGHHIAGLAGMEDLVIFILGVILLAVELLFIPGFGLIGILGIMMMVWAVMSAMIPHLPGIPWYRPTATWDQWESALIKTSLSIIGVGVLGALLAPWLPKTVLFRRLTLFDSTSREQGYTASRVTDDLVGLVGKTENQLRPAGQAWFGDKRLDVITRGDFIEGGARVRIVETHGNRIIVEECSPEEEGG